MNTSVFSSLFLIQSAFKKKKKNIVIINSKSNKELCCILKRLGLIFFFVKNNSIKISIKYNSSLSTLVHLQILKKKSKKILLSDYQILCLKKKFLNKHLLFLTTKGILLDLDILKINSSSIQGSLICII